MKHLFLILLFCSTAFGQDVRYISTSTGDDDLGDGLGWGTAWKTLGKAITDGQAAGDTVVCAGWSGSSGGNFNEQPEPTASGTGGSEIVWIDSLRYTDGYNSSPAAADSFWTATVDAQDTRSRFFVFDNDDFHHVVGFQFEDMRAGDGNGVYVNGDADGIDIFQCRFISNNRFDYRIEGGNAYGDIISCVFIGNGSIETSVVHVAGGGSGSEAISYINNTWVGTYTGDTIDITDRAVGITFRNNIIENKSTTNSDWTINIVDRDAIGDFNYNSFQGAQTDGNWFSFNGTAGSTITAWEDSVNNIDGDGATASTEEDSELKAEATTAYILASSPAAEAGTDLGYGNDRG
jgi:hypothetical protein